jgi:hypothetical protein
MPPTPALGPDPLRAVRKLVETVAEQGRELQRLQRSADLGRASIDSGALVVKTADGVEALRIGEHEDGTTAVQYVAGPTPATPSAPRVVTTPGGALVVTWDGRLLAEDGTEQGAPGDFLHVLVYVTEDQTPDVPDVFDAATAEMVGVITAPGGGSKTIGRAPGRYEVRLVAVSRSGQESTPSEPTEADVARLVEAPDLAGPLADLDERLEDAHSLLEENDEKLSALQGRFTFSDREPGPDDSEGRAEGSVWTLLTPGAEDGTTVESGRWQLRAGEWVPMGLDPTVIPELLGWLATFQQVNVSQLVATSAVMAEATVLKLFAELFTAKKITAAEIDAGSVRTALLIASAIKANMLDVDALNGKVIRGSDIIGGTVTMEGTGSGAGYNIVLNSSSLGGQATFTLPGANAPAFIRGAASGTINGYTFAAGLRISSHTTSALPTAALVQMSPSSASASGAMYVRADLALDSTSFSLAASGGATVGGGGTLQLYGANSQFTARGGTATMESILGGGLVSCYNNGTVWAIASGSGRVHLQAGGIGELNVTTNAVEMKGLASIAINDTDDGSGTAPSIKSMGIYGRNASGSTNVNITGSGYLTRVGSKRALKVAIEDLPDSVADHVLDLRPRTWFDKGEAEARARFEDDRANGVMRNPEQLDTPHTLRRYGGLIAEEVHEAAVDLGVPLLASLVQFGEDEDGAETVEGVAYDRLAVWLLSIVRRQRDQLTSQESRLAQLEATVATLAAKITTKQEDA